MCVCVCVVDGWMDGWMRSVENTCCKCKWAMLPLLPRKWKHPANLHLRTPHQLSAQHSHRNMLKSRCSFSLSPSLTLTLTLDVNRQTFQLTSSIYPTISSKKLKKKKTQLVVLVESKPNESDTCIQNLGPFGFFLSFSRLLACRTTHTTHTHTHSHSHMHTCTWVRVVVVVV